MEKTIFNSALAIHILAGILSLGSGLMAMAVRKKGGKIHNLSGQVFYWSMLVIFVTSVQFFIMYPSVLKYQFFLTIAIVSYYPNFAGKRILSMKKAISPKWYDFTAAVLVGVSGLVMMGYGFYGLFHPEIFHAFASLFLIFGVVSLLNCFGDMRLYLSKKEPAHMHWFFSHAGKMSGAFAAAVTAFCVNVVPRFLPDATPSWAFVMVWVLPGVAIGVIANRIQKHYKIKFGLKNTGLKNESLIVK